MSTQLVLHSFNDAPIAQRDSDGYMNATAMCRANGKLIADYLRLDITKAFLAELEADMGIPIAEQIQVVRGGHPEAQGTWVHPQVAVNLGQYEWKGINPIPTPGGVQSLLCLSEAGVFT